VSGASPFPPPGTRPGAGGTQATHSRGSQTPGSQTPGSQTPGSQAPGTQTPGSQARGSQLQRGATPRQQRSWTTRRALLDAAVAVIAELGWAGSTVTVIAERAGVSRGAAQHHFPTREDLVTATVEYLGEQQIEHLRARAATLPAGTPEQRLRPAIGMLCELYTGPAFRAALHLWVAASTDATLHSLVTPLQARVGREAHRTAVELLGVNEATPGVRELVQATLDLARGLGLANLLTDDTARRTRIAARWAEAVAQAGTPTQRDHTPTSPDRDPTLGAPEP
jgi:AcrR family transcriptional regulator